MARGKMLRYGHVEGPGKGREYKVAADQYFHRKGGRFVYFNAAGHVVLATKVNAATALVGWAETPKHASLKDSWKSSSTAGTDKVFVITGLEDKFEMPIDTSAASANATILGKGGQAYTTAATYATIQKFYYYATNASNNLIVEDYDSDLQTVTVRIKPSLKNVD